VVTETYINGVRSCITNLADVLSPLLQNERPDPILLFDPILLLQNERPDPILLVLNAIRRIGGNWRWLELNDYLRPIVLSTVHAFFYYAASRIKSGLSAKGLDKKMHFV
jgi:hypothetical protein